MLAVFLGLDLPDKVTNVSRGLEWGLEYVPDKVVSLGIAGC